MPSCPPKWIHFLENGSKAPEPSQLKSGEGCLSVGLCLTHSLTGCLAQSAPRQRSERRRRMHRLMVHHLACNPKEGPIESSWSTLYAISPHPAFPSPSRGS